MPIVCLMFVCLSQTISKYLQEEFGSIKVFVLTPAWFPITNEQRVLLVCCVLLQFILKVFNALICTGHTYMNALAVFISSFKHLNATLTSLLFHKRTAFDLCSEKRRLCDSPVVAFKTHFFKPHFPLKSQIL